MQRRRLRVVPGDAMRVVGRLGCWPKSDEGKAENVEKVDEKSSGPEIKALTGDKILKFGSPPLAGRLGRVETDLLNRVARQVGKTPNEALKDIFLRGALPPVVYAQLTDNGNVNQQVLMNYLDKFK